MKKLILTLTLLAFLTGCSDESKKKEPIKKLPNAEVFHDSAFKFSGNLVVNNGKQILELNYDAGKFDFEKGKNYDIYYQGNDLKAAKKVK